MTELSTIEDQGQDQAEPYASPWDAWAAVYLEWHASLEIGDESFYAELASEYGGYVVEVGCGDGRLFDAVRPDLGLDNSVVMVERAAQHPAEVPVRYGDVCTFRLDQPATMIYAPMNVLTHLDGPEQQAQALANVRANVVPGGVFAFDGLLCTVDEVARRNGNWQLRHRTDDYIVFSGTEWETPGEIAMKWHCAVDEIDGDGVVTVRRYLPVVPLRPRFAHEWREMAIEAGWSVLGHWQGYDRNEPVGENGWQSMLLQNPL